VAINGSLAKGANMETESTKARSFIIPVLDLSPHSDYSILTLLEDLAGIEGEVICVFNSTEVFNELKDHQRIDKFCYNKLNAGVSRSWNLGINLAEGKSVFILNADLHVKPEAIQELEYYLHSLPNAVFVGPQGTYLDFKNLRIIQYFEKGNFDKPIRTHDVSGFFFGIHLQRYLDHKLCFDVRYSPCFMEEWDMGMQVLNAGLASYTIPVTAFEHAWGISAEKENRPISYFGRTVYRNDILQDNRKRFLEKWFGGKK
jgi:GT2 family glycosyltransferase